MAPQMLFAEISIELGSRKKSQGRRKKKKKDVVKKKEENKGKKGREFWEVRKKN